MPSIPLPLQSNPQEYREQGDDRLVNCFSEMIGRDRYRIRAWYGLASVNTDADDVNVRGAIEVDGAVYAVFEGGGIRKFTNSGGVITRTDLDYVSGSGPVFMVRNQRSPVQIGVLTQAGRYYVIENDNVTSIPVGDLPEFISLAELGGYFFLGAADGRVFNTGLNDAANIGGLDYFTAEGHPDGLVGLFKNRLELVVFGQKTMEVWGLDSNPPGTGSPLVRIGGAVFPRGALNSICYADLDNTFFWIGEDGIVYRNANYVAQRVSHYGVERSIASEPLKAEIRAQSFTKEGNAFLIINAPSFTWVYNAASRLWHELSAYLSQRGFIEVYLTAWGDVYGFTKTNGNVYRIDSEVRTDDGVIVPVIIQGMDIGREGSLICHSLEVDFVTGRAPLVGAENVKQPVVELKWSDDGGATWSLPRTFNLGGHAGYTKRVRATRLGKTGNKWGRRFNVTISDPHVVALTTAKLNEATL